MIDFGWLLAYYDTGNFQKRKHITKNRNDKD